MADPSPITPTKTPEPRIHTAKAGDGSAWIGAGWTLFRQSPGIWVGILLLFVVINLAAGFVPLIGSLAMTVLGPVFTLGWLLGAHDLDTGKNLSAGHLFAGFSHPARNNLILLGGLQLLITFGAGLLALSIGGGALPGEVSVDPTGLLILLMLLVPVIAAFLFATPLVGFARQPLATALRLSFNACFSNWLPLLVWSLLAFALLLLGALPFGLGLLVVAPVLAASYYRMYAAIFAEATA